MRLIDADELIVMEYGGIKFVPKEFIDDAPTVDAVEVVRCGECKHADAYYHCDYSAVWNSKNDYCSHGVRKDG